MGQVARQGVEIYQGLGGEHQVKTPLQLLEAETSLGEVVVQLGREALPVRVRGPGTAGRAALSAVAHARGLYSVQEPVPPGTERGETAES